jgi:hypothetical protein
MISRMLLLLLCMPVILAAQETEPEPPSIGEHQLEANAEMQEDDYEDDAEPFRLAALRRHRIAINEADENQLKELPFLHELQIQRFLQYRRQLGKLVDLYELQAVPGWDIETIRQVLPYITLGREKDLLKDFSKRAKEGAHLFLLRAGKQLEASAGFEAADSLKTNRFAGSPWRLMMRYQYNYKNQFQYGILGDKDAGEQFFKGAQSTGFDHYSFHVFARKVWHFKSIALGDFAVNMGQGLIHWQGTGFSKSTAVLSIKKQGYQLRPYTSSGEFNFHRGLATEFGKNKWSVLLFLSSRRFNANIGNDTVSSLLTSGLNRTPSELLDRRTLKANIGGVSVSYKLFKGQFAVNAIHYQFSQPFQKKDEPYNLYAFRGTRLTNISMDYSYTYNNIHVFGEVAVDHGLNHAQIHGMLAGIDPRIDVSLVYRRFAREYQSMFSKAFAEASAPTNEAGFYIGLSTRPVAGVRIDAYADAFQFPWLRFRMDAPSGGSEYLVQLTYTPTKKIEFFSRYRAENKMQNAPAGTSVLPAMSRINRINWRTQLAVQLNNTWRIKHRLEFSRYRVDNANAETGFISFVDIGYKPMMKKQLSGSARVQYFDTDGFNSRVFAFENDLPFSYSVPFYYEKGFRWYLSLRSNLNSFLQYKALGDRDIDASVFVGQTVYPGYAGIGSGLTAIAGNRKTEFRLQFTVRW